MRQRIIGLRYQIMSIAAHGNLRKVRYHNDLMGFCQIAKNGAKCTSGTTAHASIDLVKHQGVYLVTFAQCDLQGKHHAARFATRSNFAEPLSAKALTSSKKELKRLRAPCVPLPAR